MLDFFDSMGLMFRRNALDLEMVWSEFYYVVDGWWCEAQSYIQEVRIDDDVTWENFFYLREKVHDFEKGRTKAKDSNLVQSREDITDFLEGEIGPVTEHKIFDQEKESRATISNPEISCAHIDGNSLRRWPLPGMSSRKRSTSNEP